NTHPPLSLSLVDLTRIEGVVLTGQNGTPSSFLVSQITCICCYLRDGKHCFVYVTKNSQLWPMWITLMKSFWYFQTQRIQAPPEEEEDAEEEESEELGHVDTYAEYRPSKSTIGISHPDIVVETNTLSSVPPPDITYTLSIPESTIKIGLLSALQLEAIIYACQQHEVILQNNQRAGFLIGDGAGVGKGRTVAGIILENYLKGRKKSLWFSISNDLKFDAERDLKDINAQNIPVHALNKIKYGDTATSEGVLFATYSALIGESQAGGQRRTRIKQILDWCKPDFDGVIIFDECHKAKNATSTKMGKAVLDLQNKLPRARVVYASATGASEPKNMIYMSRLGIWGEGTPFRIFDDFLHAIEKRFVGNSLQRIMFSVMWIYIFISLSFLEISLQSVHCYSRNVLIFKQSLLRLPKNPFFQLVAIISEAASSGISLQADKRVKNQRRRVHMTLELPWSADRAIQQFGRTHRSNQVTAPEYIFLISELAGERRFASIVAKRLESLGALTHGDRRATESRDLSKYNFENKYGTKALDKITKAILGHIENKVPPPKGYPGGDANFFRDMKLGMMDVGIFCKESRFGINTEKDCSITKFLNRILGLEVHKQNYLFQYFTDNFDYLIEKDKKEGKYDMGILGTKIEKQESFLTAGNPQDGQVVLYKISVDRGMTWDEAYNHSLKLSGSDEGFYLKKTKPNISVTTHKINFNIFKPNIGKQTHPESLENLHQRYRKVMAHWENQFTFSFKKCSHANWNGKCKKIEEGHECLQGMRLRQYHMLCGALLRVWKRVSDVVSDITSSSILQIVRLRTKQLNKQVVVFTAACPELNASVITKKSQPNSATDPQLAQQQHHHLLHHAPGPSTQPQLQFLSVLPSDLHAPFYTPEPISFTSSGHSVPQLVFQESPE
uniref:Protein strawberry notch homolog 2 n=1 Tax=Echeneis naucrates TaxID=173247 RepID=A0A665T5J6_ECHNA